MVCTYIIVHDKDVSICVYCARQVCDMNDRNRSIIDDMSIDVDVVVVHNMCAFIAICGRFCQTAYT